MAEKKVKFETALEQLNDIAKKLESGEAELEEALELFKKGVRLTEKCNKILDSAEQQIKIIESGDDEE